MDRVRRILRSPGTWLTATGVLVGLGWPPIAVLFLFACGPEACTYQQPHMTVAAVVGTLGLALLSFGHAQLRHEGRWAEHVGERWPATTPVPRTFASRRGKTAFVNFVLIVGGLYVFLRFRGLSGEAFEALRALVSGPDNALWFIPMTVLVAFVALWSIESRQPVPEHPLLVRQRLYVAWHKAADRMRGWTRPGTWRRRLRGVRPWRARPEQHR